MKNHLKRIASPKTWHIDRKERTFAVRPNPGTHPIRLGLSLGAILRDMIAIAATMREVRKVLNVQEVLVDGVRRKDHRFMVGLFDVVSIPVIKMYYRVVLDVKGRLTAVSIPESESGIKVCKVVGRIPVKGGKLQLNFNDGKNLLSSERVKVGDSVVVSLPALSIKKVLPLQVGAAVFLSEGKRSGSYGVLKEIRGAEAVYHDGKNEVITSTGYLFIVGGKEAEITLPAHHNEGVAKK